MSGIRTSNTVSIVLQGGVTVGELVGALRNLPPEARISLSVFKAGNDPRESDEVTLSVRTS